MVTKLLMAAAASGALIIAAPAFAQHAGGPGGPPPSAGMNSQGPAHASPMGIMNASPNSVLNRTTTTQPTMRSQTETDTDTDNTETSSGNSQATLHSQGPSHASPTGISHANENSVLARGAVASSTLGGLATNMTVNNSSGTQIGTVSQIITGPNNTIRAVVVTSSTGQTYTLPANTLSMSGSVLVTTSTVGG